jgi:lipoprotein-anchoring transpeptidase ErfK/SrfK
MFIRQILFAAAFAVAFSFLQTAQAREVVAFSSHAPGTIVVKTSERKLYYVLGDGRALRYSVAVGKAGKQWEGATYVGSKRLRPDWSPPPEVKRDVPSLPDLIPGGSPKNPMGEAALTLGAEGEYAIHGTNRPDSIGRYASYGCIRMLNRDILDLFARVRVGTTVIVTR